MGEVCSRFVVFVGSARISKSMPRVIHVQGDIRVITQGIPDAVCVFDGKVVFVLSHMEQKRAIHFVSFFQVFVNLCPVVGYRRINLKPSRRQICECAAQTESDDRQFAIAFG